LPCQIKDEGCIDIEQCTANQQVKEINLSSSKLNGTLDLSSFTNLSKLDCSHNEQLTKLFLPANLEELDCSLDESLNTIVLSPQLNSTKLNINV
jgi:hypothetical protein